MQILNHLTLKSKILAILPILACMFFMLMSLKSTQDSLNTNQALSAHITISAEVSNLIHELQK